MNAFENQKGPRKLEKIKRTSSIINYIQGKNMLTNNMENMKKYPHVLYYSFSFQFRDFLVFFALLGIVKDEFLIPLWHCVKMFVHVFCGFLLIYMKKVVYMES